MGERSHSNIFSILVDNHSGVLSRVAGLFSRRGYNIESLSVAETEHPDCSRMTIVTLGDDATAEQIFKQLEKLEEVRDVRILDPAVTVVREHVLIRVEADPGTRPAIIEMVGVFRGKVVDVSPSTMMIELTGEGEKLTAFIELMRPYGICEIVRTGLTALDRGAGRRGQDEPAGN